MEHLIFFNVLFLRKRGGHVFEIGRNNTNTKHRLRDILEWRQYYFRPPPPTNFMCVNVGGISSCVCVNVGGYTDEETECGGGKLAGLALYEGARWG